MAKPVVIKILGDAASLTRSIEISSNALTRLGGVAKATATGIGLAATGITIGSARAAVSFEKDMASVFTLLPGVSGDAMDAMSSQVLDFSKEMGVLPDEVVPALYDALSAGVPQDNVFEFMETAGKAAIGGNLEIADSVDLLSTAVNAYAAVGLDAATASDYFFTTVRLGKTTVPELQTAFSSVGPVAAALGVSLDEVGASLAVLTASGVPTSVAATQIRSAIAELGKTGTIAATAFEEINGETFPEFIENGGSFEEALLSMSESGESLIDMFGSIEAAQGVMAITANGGQAMSNAIAEMGKAAGATDAAFGTMDDTTARSMDKIKANISAVSIELGNKLLPVMAQATDWIVENWPAIEAAVIPVLQAIQAKVAEAMPYIKEAFEAVVGWIRDNWPQISATLQAFQDFLVNDVLPVVTTVLGAIITAASHVVKWIIEHWPEISAAFQAVRDFIVDDAIPAMATALEWVRDLFTTIFTHLQEFWEEWGDTITETATRIWDSIKKSVQALWDFITASWNTWKAIFEGDWSAVWDGIADMAKAVWDGLKATFNASWELFKLAWELAFEGIKTFAEDKLDDVQGFIKDLPGKLVDFLGAGAEMLKTAGGNVMGWIGEGIQGAVVAVGQALWDALPDPVKWALEHGAGGLGTIGGALGLGSSGPSFASSSIEANQALLDAVNNYTPAITPKPNVHGGPVSGSILVGERGPEILNIPNSLGGASVMANQDMAGASGGITVNVGGSTSTAQEIGDEIMWQLRRNG